MKGRMWEMVYKKDWEIIMGGYNQSCLFGKIIQVDIFEELRNMVYWLQKNISVPHTFARPELGTRQS